MAEEYVIVPRGAKNMTHEDIIFYLRLIFISAGSSRTLRLVHGDHGVERGLKQLVLMDTFTH